jgi:predicted nucleic acid-binding protein
VKLPLREPEHEALRVELDRWDGVVSSALLRTEAVRACRRYGPDRAAAARAGLALVALLPVDDLVLARAAELEPAAMRSLDAIHVATAASLEGDLGVLLAYDERLLAAAGSAGLPVGAPG